NCIKDGIILYFYNYAPGAAGCKQFTEIRRKERQQMPKLLEDEKNIFERIIQNISAPMFVIDTTHTILIWNNALAKLTGRSSFQMKTTKQQWNPFYPARRPMLADLLIDRQRPSGESLYADFETPPRVDGTFRAEGWYENIGGKRR